MTNDKLPEEIVKQIQLDSIQYAEHDWKPLSPDSPDWMTNAKDYQAGATAWAPWKVKYNEAKKLLDEVFRKHEAGLLPDRFIYKKIKTFLNEEH